MTMQVVGHVLIRGNLETGEKEILDGPSSESFHELANSLNYDHGEEIRKHMVGYIFEGKFIPKKKYIWFDGVVPHGTKEES